MAEPLIFDRDAALNRVDGDQELYSELVDMFFEEYPRMLSEIKEARKTGEAKKIQESAHSMKSALGNLGAMKAFAIAQVIEVNGAKNRLEMIDANVKTLEDEIAKYQGAIKSFLGRAP